MRSRRPVLPQAVALLGGLGFASLGFAVLDSTPDARATARRPPHTFLSPAAEPIAAPETSSQSSAPAPLQTAPRDAAALTREATRRLQDYIRIDTSNPPGDVRQAAEFVAGLLEREGVPVTRYQSAPDRIIVVGRLKGAGRGKPILLLHHMDVVPADRMRWKVDPFAGVVDGGYVWGRGAMDMKGLGIIHLLAFLEIKRRGVPLDRDIVLMAVPDEEVGGELGARWMIEHHWDALDPEYVLDEGGLGSRDLFAPNRLVFGISVAEKKILWLRVRAEGEAGHGSQPHDRNPNDRLVRALARVLAEPPPPGGGPVLEAMRRRLGELARNRFTHAIQHSTMSLTSLRAGVGEPPKVNVIPSVAEATLDCRLLPGVGARRWLEELRRRLGDPELTVDVIYESPDPVVTPHDTPLFRALASAITRRYPDAVVTPTLIPYGTDANSFRARGVHGYGLTPMILPAEVVASMHGDAERLPVDGLGDAILILADALVQVAGRPPSAVLPAPGPHRGSSVRAGTSASRL
ncbi:MAG TPA: M20/M25/M40 family metallo-hydrolase [Vicinamibacterales bacterium]|nr:M20/M25/M40 family metallo-hydrolase [Vicinamibacterales bacterium]